MSETTRQLGKPDRISKSVKGIEKNLSFLTENLSNFDSIITRLIEQRIILQTESDLIRAELTELRRNQKLLELLRKKGWDDLEQRVLDILEVTNNKRCADKIRGDKPIEVSQKVKVENVNQASDPLIVQPGKPDKVNTYYNHSAGHKPFRKKIAFISIAILIVAAAGGSLVYALSQWIQNSQNDSNHKEFAQYKMDSSNVMQMAMPHNVVSGNGNTKLKDLVITYLKSISGFKTLSGIIPYGNPINSLNGIEKVKKIAGVYPAIVTLFFPQYLSGDPEKQKFIDDVVKNWKSGSMVQLIWEYGKHPALSLKPKDGEKPEKIFADILKDGSRLNTEWKKQLDFVASILIQLQNQGVVPICDLLPFINAKKSRFWQGLDGSKGRISFYKLTYKYLTDQHNLNSLIWTYSLYVENTDYTLKYWPGNNYVDVVSVTVLDEKEISAKVYHDLLQMVPHKPISMDCLYKVPSIQFLQLQPRWAWFTVEGASLFNLTVNHDLNIKATFQYPSVINRGVVVDIFKVK